VRVLRPLSVPVLVLVKSHRLLSPFGETSVVGGYVLQRSVLGCDDIVA
jgi:hypothetical protein